MCVKYFGVCDYEVCSLLSGTYEITDVSITKNSTTVCFSCVFLTHSMASGCYLTLKPDQDIMDKCDMNTISCMLTLWRNTSSQEFTSTVKGCKELVLYEGSYFLSAVLIDSNGSIQPSIVVTRSTSLQGETCTGAG